MTEEEIKQYAHEYAEKQIKHKMAVHDIFNKEQATKEIEQAFIEGTDFMYYSNNEELKKELTEKDKALKDITELYEKCSDEMRRLGKVVQEKDRQIEELEAQIEKMKCCGNCQTVRDAEGNCYLKKDGKCKNLSEWEIKEK